MRDERGSATMWMLGLSVLLLLFGGIALDYWRGLALQRELAAVADSAAIAGASGIDEVVYRQSGEIVLDRERTTTLVLKLIDFQDIDLTSVDVLLSADGSAVSVTLESALELGLLGVFVNDDSPIMVRATATAAPRRIP